MTKEGEPCFNNCTMHNKHENSVSLELLILTRAAFTEQDNSY